MVFTKITTKYINYLLNIQIIEHFFPFYQAELIENIK